MSVRLGTPSVLTPSGVIGYCQYAPASAVGKSIVSSTITDIDATNLVVTFTAPPSGKVLVTLNAFVQVDAAGSPLKWGLRNGSTDVVGSFATAANWASANNNVNAVTTTTAIDVTPGVTYTWKWAWARVSGSATCYLWIGGDANSNCGPATMKVEALGGAIAATTDADVTPVAPNDQTGTTYTFVLADKHRSVNANNASAQTYTIPLNSAVPYPIGTVLRLNQKGAGQITWAITATGTLRTPRGGKSGAQYTGSYAEKVGTDEWYIGGDVVA